MTSSTSLRVLLVEDDAEDVKLISKLLQGQRTRFDIVWVETLKDAIEKLNTDQFDIVLSDLSLPDSVGFSTVTELSQQSQKTPIIAFTALEDEEIERAILDAGAQDYIVKGELDGRTIGRSIVHAVQRQLARNEIQALVQELEANRTQLRDHARLLRTKNERLEHVYNTAKEFIGNISHDFRTPLAVIMDYVDILREGMAGEVNAEQKQMLAKVSIRADDLNIMVDDLLDVSKLESGVLCAWRRPVELAAILESVEPMLRQRASVRGVELVIEPAVDIPSIFCDAEKVTRVITNLVVNAIKYSGTEGRVRVWSTLDVDQDAVTIGISDNGAGIDPQMLDKLFQRHRQLNDATNLKTKGFGLGLSIAKQLCELNLGELGVQSVPNQGTTFTFSLPFAIPDQVFRRWLDLHAMKLDEVQLVLINAENCEDEKLLDEFDLFLNCLLRSEDLVLRTSQDAWVLAMATSTLESHNWLRRSKEEWHSHNRNRANGRLPEFQAKIMARWIPAEGALVAYEQFKRLASIRDAPMLQEV